MSKLLKYEFKKSKNVTLAILLVTVIGEALFVTGTIAGAIPLTSSGALILALAATFGIFIMAVLSIDILHRELNTNQSYMLFLTPRNSYQILGSKILANAISLSLLTVLFAVLAALDLLLIGIREVGMPVPADGIRRALGSAYLYMPTGVGKTIATAAAIAYGSWLFLIVTALAPSSSCRTNLPLSRLLLQKRPCAPVSMPLSSSSSSVSADGSWITD